MNSIEQRLEYLEEACDVLRMQNHVLATAFKGMVRALPADIAQDVIESVQLAFEDALAELNYEDSPHADLFHDVTYAFFREKER
ncbi:hypothetical protein BWD09_12335 [Neisseria dentiae]|uniref:Uncharacterized protein n=1 Tax=Neisseria dentiae TaxID=194197 RepID=A0A1X3D209_9NEIS|nr:hypothetical protein [Neisseria dentiae]OSI13806.1 hypothetical protein BWD09_12335 [Neisseria dentiae]QMT45802.1 hypothetical protein H3L92_03045 [Neisseria dentiae]STZ51782.1 Uncharacterised protein [Neisseria dentiae]